MTNEPLSQAEVGTVSRMLQRHPGVTFSYLPADDCFARARYLVSLPYAGPVRGIGIGCGVCQGAGDTLDGAYHVALARLNDAVDQKVAA